MGRLPRVGLVYGWIVNLGIGVNYKEFYLRISLLNIQFYMFDSVNQTSKIFYLF